MKKKTIAKTEFGSVVILWEWTDEVPRVTRILLSRPKLSAKQASLLHYPSARTATCRKIEDLAANIVRFLDGDKVTFSLDLVDLSLCSPFQARVLRAEHAIPRGNVSTYRLIGAYLGNPNSARAVGNALAKNPYPIVVPCHRAIHSDHSLSGYQGGAEMKRTLLEREGISFDRSGRVICSRMHYQEYLPRTGSAKRI